MYNFMLISSRFLHLCYVDIGRLEGSNPKAIMEFLIQACDYK